MTSVYYRFFNEIHSRLDENYNNPRYDEIQVLLDKNKFKRTVSLNDKSIVTDKTSGKTPDGIRYLPEGNAPFLEHRILIMKK